MDQKDVLYVKEEGIATLTLNRPDVRNAYVPGIVEGIYQGLEQARGDSEVRVLVITGTGQAFCSGADVKSMGTNEQRPSTLRYKKGNRSRLNWLSLALQKCDKPIIAAINGVAVGGGLDLALGCDIRIASDKARFSEIYVRRGIIPAQGGVFLLPRLIGLDKACQMILTGEMIEAHEAERIG